MWQKIWDRILELFTNAGGEDISAVDLTADLDSLAAADGRGLNWRESVVDFLTLLGIDSSKENREELAVELGVDKKLAVGSAARNEALRLAVYKKIFDNGGNIPASLLD